MINKTTICLFLSVAFVPLLTSAKDNKHDAHYKSVSDDVIAAQRAQLATMTKDKGVGPQSPRDIDVKTGSNDVLFKTAPDYTAMNLCNIHFHKNAEHKGGEFTEYAGNGDGHGYQSGYKYTGKLSTTELKSTATAICPSQHGGLNSGDTIEVHYVHSTAQVKPGPTLASCLDDSNKPPQLRVETQVYVLVNDHNALSFDNLTAHKVSNDFHQAMSIPSNTGAPIQYLGSTTGPDFNEAASPLQVTWNVRPKVAKVNIATVGEWCKGNAFEEDHAHGVRNLITNPELLSEINN